ncbi:thiol peroxidase [Microbacterium sp. APC 3898]|uniref:Thiol peroxidase n=2 Tax=Planococcus TaxID=1372 RepID=A0ABT7ZIR6_9BACL|nr:MULTISPECIES: thiol peroxidase [Terrabacteria group]MBD8016549.1 thiol peroxidase [Planococcus wigleyi]MDN3427042.1 thiol peroxidase [Planococcus sp. APC 4016]MDN3439598.1 thiol peroxidase [Planococcus sp. APC 3900]MDN3499808.1 thiol peroxidase [Microbacterium sp. APC 3898]
MVQITFKKNPVTLPNKEVKVGEQAPEFTVLSTGLEPVTLKDTAGKIRLVSVVPSLDTGVCSDQTKRFSEEAASLGDDVEVLTISADLPFAQKRWTEINKVDAITTLSDHRDLSFGEAYGVTMQELRLLARSIFVIDGNDKIAYVEYVPEGTDHPDYEKALNAVKELTN